MGWSWHEEQATPVDVIEVVAEMIRAEAHALEGKT